MVSQRNNLEEMGWKQRRSPIQTDNLAAAGVVINTIVPRKLKAMDRRLCWLRCRDSQRLIPLLLGPRLTELGDYSTKHYPPLCHESKRIPFYGLTLHIHDVRSEPVSV